MQRVLTEVRKINQAVCSNLSEKKGGVYALFTDGSASQVAWARSVKGTLQVHRVDNWRWMVPMRVWQERKEG